MRTFIMRWRVAALALAVITLCMKVVVPSGMMIDLHAKVLTIAVCKDSLGAVTKTQIVIPAKSGGESEPDGKQQGTCAFASLNAALIGGADPALLLLALAFILALAFAPVSVACPRRPAYLHPPLRGPPALA
ncbi:hypothetical protein C7W88_22205 (plasmid) [Novosphingobium sp. THN1]|nr:hypothetical protein C7W88_22205 [Novosphingobium sp. THN1]